MTTDQCAFIDSALRNHIRLESAIRSYIRALASGETSIMPEKFWPHGFSRWQFSVDAGCWIACGAGANRDSAPPSYICLGDRMAHADYGLDSFGIRWTGSSVDNWHSHNFCAFDAALMWVKSARVPEFGPLLWSDLYGGWR